MKQIIMKYSKSTNGFYEAGIHGDNIPLDAVEITNAEHTALLDAQSLGGRIEGDIHGRPVAVFPVALTAAELLTHSKLAQIETITAACKEAIVSGFASSALGASHVYPSKPADQTNLIGAVAGGLADVYFWCADSYGAWAITLHTAAQIKQVLADAGTQRMAYSAQLAALVKQINDAPTPDDVAKIVWVVHKAASEASADPAAYDFSKNWPTSFSDHISNTQP